MQLNTHCIRSQLVANTGSNKLSFCVDDASSSATAAETGKTVLTRNDISSVDVANNTNEYAIATDTEHASDPSIDLLISAVHLCTPYRLPTSAANVSPTPIVTIPETAAINAIGYRSSSLCSNYEGRVNINGNAQPMSRYMCDRISGPRSHVRPDNNFGNDRLRFSDGGLSFGTLTAATCYSVNCSMKVSMTWWSISGSHTWKMRIYSTATNMTNAAA